MFLAVALGIFTGLAISCQSPTNAALARHVGAIQASLTNFIIGGGISFLLMLAFGTGNFAGALSVPAWQLIGGFYGALLVVCVVFVTPKLGVALMMVSLMLGELVGGVIVDAFGFAGAAVVPAAPMRIAGCVVAGAGILAVFRGTAGSVRPTCKQLLYLGIPFASATFASLQPPTNSALAANIGSLEAACVNFAGGILALLVVTLILNRGKLNRYTGAKPWHLTGGIYGAACIACQVAAASTLGVSLWNVCTMLGQLAGSMAIDAGGLFAIKKRPLNVWRVGGALLMLAGIMMVTYAKSAGV